MAVAATGCTRATPTTVDHSAHDAATQAATPSTPNPCDLVTAVEVSAAIHATVSAEPAAEGNGLPGQVTCHFTQPNSISSVSVAVWPADATLFDRMKTQAGSVHDLPGLGDKAFGEPRAVYVLHGGWMVNVVGGGSAGPISTRPLMTIRRDTSPHVYRRVQPFGERLRH